MTYKCPYTELCRTEALREFADFPEFTIILQQRLQCSERDDSRARQCAVRLGLPTLEIPSFGGYIQARRRAQHISQHSFAQNIGVDLQVLRDLELNKADSTKIPRSLIESIANALSESVDYLIAISRKPSLLNTSRIGAVFARTTSTDDTQEPK